MLHALHEEGFSITPRELIRVRTKHRWLLRDSHGAGPGVVAGAKKSHSIEDDRPGSEHDASNDEAGNDDAGPFEGLLAGEARKPPASQQVLEQRHEKEARSAALFASGKRRRRTRQYAGLPADPPGPPRFPSETTLTEGQSILGLDRATYAAVRERFEGICSARGILKKTVAGPEAWERAKLDLVGAFPHLQKVMRPGAGGGKEKRDLALDVICSDVTKRMRAGGEKGPVLADAKNVLGLNPAESREVRSALYDMLEADGFTSKLAMGPDRWTELKHKWIDGSELLQKVLSRLDDPDTHERKTKAVEALATDVMKRLREDHSKRKGDRQDKGKSPADPMGETEYGEANVDMGGMAEDATGFAAAMLVSDQNAHPQRMGHLGNPQMSMDLVMNAQLDEQLLLGAHAHQTPFPMSTHHHHHHHQTHPQFMGAPDPSPFDAGPSSSAAAAAAAAAAAYPAAAASAANFIGVYLRELGPQSLGSPLGDAWIALLSAAPSLEELRQVAAQKVPGSACVEVIGLIRMPNDDYVPLPIHDDAQLAAHLAQTAPVFHVRLAF